MIVVGGKEAPDKEVRLPGKSRSSESSHGGIKAGQESSKEKGDLN